MKGVYIFLADGFEDVEALGTADVLRRGKVPVQLVSITDEPFVVSSHGVAVGVDMSFDMFTDAVELGSATAADVMIFPGGMPGTKNLAACKPLMKLMKDHYAEGGTVAAICAAPGLVLSQLDGLEGKKVTCFDSFEGYLQEKGAEFIPKPAIADGRIVTGRSAGHATAFGLKILGVIKDEETVAQVRHAMLLDTLPE